MGCAGVHMTIKASFGALLNLDVILVQKKNHLSQTIPYNPFLTAIVLIDFACPQIFF